MKFRVTNIGVDHFAKVHAGGMKLHYTRVAAGEGYSDAPETVVEIDSRQNLQLEEAQVNGEYVMLTFLLTNLELVQGYQLRQIGIFAQDYQTGQEVLVLIGQDEVGDPIPLPTDKEVEYLFNVGLKVSNVAEVSFDFSVNDFLRKKYFYEHLADASNPHKVTKAQVGLGLVPNVETNDQTPTWACPKERQYIQSGATLASNMGRLERFQRDIKPNAFVEADDPFVLMTTTNYVAVGERTTGSFYAFLTAERGVQVITFNRYIDNLAENPKVSRTLYRQEKSTRATAERDESPYKAVCHNLVIILEGQAPDREEGKLYFKERTVKG